MSVKGTQQLALSYPYKNINSANKYLLNPFLFTKHCFEGWENNSEKKKHTVLPLLLWSRVKSRSSNVKMKHLDAKGSQELMALFSLFCGTLVYFFLSLCS